MSRKSAVATLVTLSITTVLAASHASAVTFASFGYTGGTAFALAGNAFTASETGTFSSAVPISSGYGATTFTANLILTGTLVSGTGAAITLTANPSNTIIVQSIGSLNFSIIGTSGLATGKNLLSGSLLTVAGDVLQGSVNNATQSSTASVNVSGSDSNINYFSDIYSFLPGSRDLTATLSNITPSILTVNGTTTVIPNVETITTGDLEAFMADASLNFGATPGPNPGPPNPGSVPEPGMVAMLFGMGASGMMLALGRQRKR